MGFIYLALIIAAVFAYQAWLFRAVKPRVIRTSASPDQLREIFSQKIATLGWSIVDDGDPIVAQSTLMAGIRQQIALEIVNHGDDGTVASLTVPRYSKKILGAPSKAHTIRMRMNSFRRALRSLDTAAVVDYA